MNIFDILYIFYLFSIGGAISLIFVSQVWNSMNNGEEEEEEEENYLDSYDLSNLKNKKCQPNSKNIIIEHTPDDGMIVMRYSIKNEGFEYWSNSKLVSFKVLKTVCRKYCLTFDTKLLYIDGNKEMEKQKKLYEERVKKEDEKKEDEDDLDNNSVFVKPKIEKKKEVFKPVWFENKFMRRGNIPDSPLCEKMNKVSKKVELSFEDFKKMMKSD
tara:strand:+ start:1028 stop:1666 length:639 start_codon:yes stop_codon:yes gene_type:complete